MTWVKTTVVPWDSHQRPAFDGHRELEINFDFVATKSEHAYTDQDGITRTGTIAHMSNGASYILVHTPDQYPGA